MSLPVETHLGPYEVLGLIGAGGMGEVYRARDPRLGREVAIKVVLTKGSPSADRLRRFEDEARAAAALSHPNILTVFDIGMHDGQPYLVMELLQGETLRRRIERGALPAGKAVELGIQVCAGLEAAHARGLVHRDLKPENLFLTEDGRVKVLDFGLAKLTRGEGAPFEGQARTATVPGVILGTVGYLSPEQARGLEADARSDLFALGAILYEMLSGQRAFAGATPADTLSAILNHEPPAVTTASGPLPLAVERIVRRCLQKQPEDRFRSAQDLALALESVGGSAAEGLASGEEEEEEERSPYPGLTAFTEADTLEALHENVRDAVRCHFEESERPRVVRLHFVRDQLIAV
jgi:eukaryotic-like serine/threonine-protein kinase